MASALEFLGIRTTNACVGAAESSAGLARRYSRILRAVVHIDVQDGQFVLFHRATQNIYRLEQSRAAIACRGESDRASRATRPAPSVLQDRSQRTISVRQSVVRKDAKTGNLSDDSPPNLGLSLSRSGTTTSRASPHYDVPFPSYQGVELDPIPPIVARNDHHPIAYIPPAVRWR